MPHPLSEFVLSAFTTEDTHLDAPKIAKFMGVVLGDGRLLSAYITVATDVLDRLVEDGRIKREATTGWYVRTAMP
jgi:hypothetical protein